jgi:hypothetical protein
MRTAGALALCGLMGCGENSDGTPAGAPKPYPVIGCETIDPAACDVNATACQDKLLKLAACMRGSEPGELLPVTHMTADQYAATLEAEAATEAPAPEAPHVAVTLTRLGLAEARALDSGASVMRQSTEVAAFYRWDSKDIVLIDRPDVTPLDSNGALLHEFVHALQDRESDLTAYARAHFDGPADALLATDAIVEGEARFHEYVYALSLLGYDPHTVNLNTFFGNLVANDEPLFLDEPSPILMAQYVFPYDWGARYVHLAWSGHQSMLGLLAKPPETTHTILASVDRVTDDAFTPSDIAAPSAPDTWTELRAEVLGAFGTFLMLQKLAGTEPARALALAWRGDRLSVYAGSEASGDQTTTAFVWSCEFDGDAHASDAGELLAHGLEGVAVHVSGTRVTVAAADNGADVSWASALPPQ